MKDKNKPIFPTLKQSYDIMQNHYSNTRETLPSEVGIAYEIVMTCVYNRLLAEYNRKKDSKNV